jgi:hypothetical protein
LDQPYLVPFSRGSAWILRSLGHKCAAAVSYIIPSLLMQFFERSLLLELGPHFSKVAVLADPLAWAYVGQHVITTGAVAEL